MLSTSQTNSTLIAITKILIYYGYFFMLIFGNIGNILSLVLFLRKNVRLTSCNNYFLASAFSNFVALNIGIIPLLYMEIERVEETVLYCKLQEYIMNAALQISRYLIVIASFDRFALCSTNAFLRKFCNVRIARRYVIPSTILMWFVLPLHIPFWITFDNNVCRFVGKIMHYDTIYSIIMVGIIPPGLMLVFSLLIFRNLKLRQRRRQIQPFIVENSMQQTTENQRLRIKEQRLRVKDKHVLAMLLVQVLAYVISTTPYTISKFYIVVAIDRVNNSAEDISVVIFIIYIADMLRFVCPFISFYLFLIVSKLYRKEMVSVIVTVYHRCSLLWRKHSDDHQDTGYATHNLSSIRADQNQQHENQANLSLDATVD